MRGWHDDVFLFEQFAGHSCGTHAEREKLTKSDRGEEKPGRREGGGGRGRGGGGDGGGGKGGREREEEQKEEQEEEEEEEEEEGGKDSQHMNITAKKHLT